MLQKWKTSATVVKSVPCGRLNINNATRSRIWESYLFMYLYDWKPVRLSYMLKKKQGVSYYLHFEIFFITAAGHSYLISVILAFSHTHRQLYYIISYLLLNVCCRFPMNAPANICNTTHDSYTSMYFEVNI